MYVHPMYILQSRGQRKMWIVRKQWTHDECITPGFHLYYSHWYYIKMHSFNSWKICSLLNAEVLCIWFRTMQVLLILLSTRSEWVSLTTACQIKNPALEHIDNRTIWVRRKPTSIRSTCTHCSIPDFTLGDAWRKAMVFGFS